MNTFIKTLPIVAALGTASPAWSFVIDFDTDGNGNAITEGQVIDNEYFSGIPGASGLTAYFSAINLSSGPDLAVVYDSDPGTGRDPDLEAPFTNVLNGDGITNGTTLNPGNVLILQENDWGCSGPNPTFCSHPDDEGSRPAGSFEITFNEEITLESIDLFDIEWVELGGIKLYNASDVLLASYDITGTGGDNTYTTLSLLTDNVARMTIDMGGSGAIDNIVGSYTPPGGGGGIPNPASLALMLLGLGVIARRRRK